MRLTAIHSHFHWLFNICLQQVLQCVIILILQGFKIIQNYCLFAFITKNIYLNKKYTHTNQYSNTSFKSKHLAAGSWKILDGHRVYRFDILRKSLGPEEYIRKLWKLNVSSVKDYIKSMKCSVRKNMHKKIKQCFSFPWPFLTINW